MKSILCGVDGSERGERALAWAARQAHRTGSKLTLLAIIDLDMMKTFGVSSNELDHAAVRMLEMSRNAVFEKYPDVVVDHLVVNDNIIDALIDEAGRHDMVVLGSHNGATIGETLGGSKGVRVSVSVSVPTVVVPCDWDEDSEAEGIVVGVGPDDVSVNAIQFGVAEALREGCELELLSAWGLPPIISRPAEAMGGGLGPVGERLQQELDESIALLKEQHPDLNVVGRSVEGSSPSRVIVDRSKGKELLVMGTHSRKAFGRALFGSVGHSVLLNLQVPTVIVPQV